MSVEEITSQEQLDTLLNDNSNKLIVIDFFATWCGPCVMIAPKIAEMAGEFRDVVFLKVDVDQCEDIVATYGISCMPTFKFIKNSQVVETVQGANEDTLRQKISANK